MKINVGDYVRTPNGVIAKIIDIKDDEGQYFINNNAVSLSSKTYISDKNITIGENFKHSPNIIDLVEVGDYVNGWRVNWVKKEEDGIFLKIGTITSFVSKNETDPYLTQDYDEADKMCKLKSIVTKEQIEAMQYLVKED